jgi:hypothetical protein
VTAVVEGDGTDALRLPVASCALVDRARVERAIGSTLATREAPAAEDEWLLWVAALGTRADANAVSGLYARSLALVWLLKQYAHAISEQTKRGGYVDMDATNRPDAIAVLRQLGFRDAPRVSGFSPSGRHLRQDATG